jgi:hypothetical protein
VAAAQSPGLREGIKFSKGLYRVPLRSKLPLLPVLLAHCLCCCQLRVGRLVNEPCLRPPRLAASRRAVDQWREPNPAPR